MAYAKRSCFDERIRREDAINLAYSAALAKNLSREGFPTSRGRLPAASLKLLTEKPRSSIPVRCDRVNRPINGLYSVTLRDFLHNYSEELGDYYGEDFGQDQYVGDYRYGDTLIFCLVDGGEDHLPVDIKKKIRKAGKWRRDKLKHQWSYVNPLNRIHGYIILKDVTNENCPGKTLSISVVCSTHYTKKRGIGKHLMDLAKEYAQKLGYNDIILEVANEFSDMGREEDEEEEDEEDEEEEEEEEEEEDEEYYGCWFPDENVMDILGEEFWKKCMRKNKRGIPYFNLEQEYIQDCIWEYLNMEKNSETEELWKGTEKRYIDDEEPKEYEYGGFWYHKGKNSQIRLIQFYEMHGYREDPKIHKEWCCFSESPFPTMRLKIL
jgi:ribosomal protein S18 acetylase RimI-like enzyme